MPPQCAWPLAGSSHPCQEVSTLPAAAGAGMLLRAPLALRQPPRRRPPPAAIPARPALPAPTVQGERAAGVPGRRGRARTAGSVPPPPPLPRPPGPDVGARRCPPPPRCVPPAGCGGQRGGLHQPRLYSGPWAAGRGRECGTGRAASATRQGGRGSGAAGRGAPRRGGISRSTGTPTPPSRPAARHPRSLHPGTSHPRPLGTPAPSQPPAPTPLWHPWLLHTTAPRHLAPSERVRPQPLAALPSALPPLSPPRPGQPRLP